jgi:hypothetical protein
VIQRLDSAKNHVTHAAILFVQARAKSGNKGPRTPDPAISAVDYYHLVLPVLRLVNASGDHGADAGLECCG